MRPSASRGPSGRCRSASLLFPSSVSLPVCPVLALVLSLTLSILLPISLALKSYPPVSMSSTPNFFSVSASFPVTRRLSTLQDFSLLPPLSFSLFIPCFPQSPSLLGVSLPFLWESPKAGHSFLSGRTPSAGAHEVYTFRCWSLGQPAQVSAFCLPTWQAS